MKNYLTETIGTFFLVLTIGLTVVGKLAAAPLAIGLMLVALVYMGAPISGAHYNPAVSLVFLLRGALRGSEFIAYVASQVLGATLASLTVLAVLGETFAPAPAETASTLGVLLIEALFTFALVLVILNTAVTPEVRGNSYYGLAIGLTIVGAAYAGGPISGGAYNPAVGFGPIVIDTLFGSGSLENLGLYLLGPFTGGIAGGAAYKLQNPA